MLPSMYPQKVALQHPRNLKIQFEIWALSPLTADKSTPRAISFKYIQIALVIFLKIGSRNYHNQIISMKVYKCVTSLTNGQCSRFIINEIGPYQCMDLCCALSSLSNLYD